MCADLPTEDLAQAQPGHIAAGAGQRLGKNVGGKGSTRSVLCGRQDEVGLCLQAFSVRVVGSSLVVDVVIDVTAAPTLWSLSSSRFFG